MRAGFGCPWRSISASACRYPGGSALSSRNTRLCVSWSLLWYVAEPVLSYEATVDAVFPAPDPGAFQRKSPPGGDCVAIPTADKGKRTRGRAEPFGGIARERAAQVARENRPLPNGENAGFGPGLADHGCNVSLTATKPRASVASPLCAIHGGAYAPVAHTAACASKRSPPSSSSPFLPA